MINKYHSVTVKPTIKASKQTSAFAAGDVLFDWTPFDVPKGSNLLRCTVVLVRGTNGADQAAVDMELFFAKSIDGTAPSTLGDLNDPVDTATATGTSTTGWFNNIIGYNYLDVSANNTGSSDDLVYMNTLQCGAPRASSGVVLTGEPNSGTNVGYDKIYVAGITQGALDFSTTVLARGGEADGVTTVETDKGSNDDPNADLIFQPGDVLHSATDDVLGTIKTIEAFGSSKQDITFTAGTTDIIADNEEIYNVNPVTLIFSFER